MIARAHLRVVATPKADVDDAALLSRIATGDRAALGTLYDRYARSFYLFARRLTNDGSAEDLVQLVFLRVHKIAPSYDPSASSARPWLFGITVRVAQEQRRSAHRFAGLLSRLLDARGTGAAEPFHGASDIERAIGGLSPAKREVLLLTDVEGFSCEEVARMLSIPVGTVYTRRHHTRKELRAKLETTR